MAEATQLREVVFDDLRSGLKTDAELDRAEPELRVQWITWDSGFRESGLQVGDRIVAVNGNPITRPPDLNELRRMVRELPGGLNEKDVYRAAGLEDASPLSLTIQRRRPNEGWLTQEVIGKVRAERQYYYPSGRRGLGPTGPDTLANDGFESAWSSWYDKRVFDWSRVLDGGWQGRLDTRKTLAEHMAEKPRVDFLREKFPGPFTDAVWSDFEAVRASLEGWKYELAPGALDFRELEEERVKLVRAASETAWKDFLDKHAAEIIPAFPSIDPFREDVLPRVGKLVTLGPIGPRDWVVNVGVNYLTSSRGGYWYFVPVDAPAMLRAFRAMYRYRRFVSPDIREDVELVGRILPEPRMMAVQRRTAAGLEIEPVAVMIDKKMFVDPSVIRDIESPLRDIDSPFAGEDALKKQSSGVPANDASPREVLQALVAALKAGDQDTWNALFADWSLLAGEGRPLYRAFYPYTPANRNEDWVRARRLILDKLYDVRVAWMSEPRVVLQTDSFEGAPLIEEVRAEMDHIGRFDDEYRAFNGLSVNRLWKLQRRDGGPWRIASQHGI